MKLHFKFQKINFMFLNEILKIKYRYAQKLKLKLFISKKISHVHFIDLINSKTSVSISPVLPHLYMLYISPLFLNQ